MYVAGGGGKSVSLMDEPLSKISKKMICKVVTGWLIVMAIDTTNNAYTLF